MQELTVYRQNEIDETTSMAKIGQYLSRAEKHFLLNAPWPSYPYKPTVGFSIAYSDSGIFLQFDVTEKYIKGSHGKINEAVYEDSCVEFFISFDNATTYYNFEFNCIGTVLAGFGKRRANRELLPETVLDKISFQAVIVREKRESLVKWQLTLSIPLQAFLFHPLTSLQGQQCRANFYKCGDSLPQPHFLSWSDIQSNEPDFHLPQYFGALLFE